MRPVRLCGCSAGSLTAVQGCGGTVPVAETSKPPGRLRYHATASPDCMQRYFPNGVTLPALAADPAPMFNPKDNLQQAWVRQVFGKSPASPCHSLPSTQGFADACRAGLG